MTKDKTLKLALEALEQYLPYQRNEKERIAFAAIKEALAQPEHHPQHSHSHQEMYAELHLYEEISQHYAKCNPGAANLRDWVSERMDKPVQPVQPVQPQEPVAFYNPQKGGFYWAKPTTIHAPLAVEFVPLALYTSPPQRQWVGLTDEEREQHRDDWRSNIHDREIMAIEATLKKKNHDTR